MRIASAMRSTAGHLALKTRRTAGRWWTKHTLASLVVGVGTCGLAGCGSELVDADHARHITRERAALLKRQAPPKCEFRTTASDEASADAMTGAKLDYERQCYRHAEIIARARLTSLQGAIQDSVKAARRDQTSNP